MPQGVWGSTYLSEVHLLTKVMRFENASLSRRRSLFHHTISYLTTISSTNIQESPSTEGYHAGSDLIPAILNRT